MAGAVLGTLGRDFRTSIQSRSLMGATAVVCESSLAEDACVGLLYYILDGESVCDLWDLVVGIATLNE